MNSRWHDPANEELVDNQTTFHLLLSFFINELNNCPGKISTKTLKVPVLLVLLNPGNSGLFKHDLTQCFLPEMLYFHALAVSSQLDIDQGGGKGKRILNDHVINLS